MTTSYETARAAPTVPPWLARRAAVLSTERTCLLVLGLAMVAAGAFNLYQTRQMSFYSDEYTYFVGSRGFDLEALFSPHNGHLILVPRLLYAAVFAVIGPEYGAFRILQAGSMLLVVGLLYALIRPRVGPAAALAPCFVLLVFGASWEVTLVPVGLTHVICLAAGLGALLALERDTTRGDVAACALLLVAVCTFSIGIDFAIGIAVMLLLRVGGLGRLWVAALPAFVFVGVKAFAPTLTGPAYNTYAGFDVTNVSQVPAYAAEAAAAVCAALTGTFYATVSPLGPASDSEVAPWGYAVAALGLVWIVRRLGVKGVALGAAGSLAMLAAFWLSAGMVAGPNRHPASNRYLFAGAIFVILVATDAARGLRVRPYAVVILMLTAVGAAGLNIQKLRTAAAIVRDNGDQLRIAATSMEITRGVGGKEFSAVSFDQFLAQAAVLVGGGTAAYHEAADRNGPLGLTLPELRVQGEALRQTADRTIAAQLVQKPRLVTAGAAKALTGGACVTRTASAATPVSVTVPAGGAVVRSSVAQEVSLRRFALYPSVSAGALPRARARTLIAPADRAPDPWVAVFSRGRITSCPPA